MRPIALALILLLPDRLPSLLVLVGFWIPPAVAGWLAAGSLQRSTRRYRATVTFAVLATFRPRLQWLAPPVGGSASATTSRLGSFESPNLGQRQRVLDEIPVAVLPDPAQVLERLGGVAAQRQVHADVSVRLGQLVIIDA